MTVDHALVTHSSAFFSEAGVAFVEGLLDVLLVARAMTGADGRLVLVFATVTEEICLFSWVVLYKSMSLVAVQCTGPAAAEIGVSPPAGVALEPVLLDESVLVLVEGALLSRGSLLWRDTTWNSL